MFVSPCTLLGRRQVLAQRQAEARNFRQASLKLGSHQAIIQTGLCGGGGE